MPNSSYNIVVQQDSRNVVVQTPGPKGLQGNAGTGMSSIAVSTDSGNTGAIAGNAAISIVGDGNRISTSASGSTITITDTGLRQLTIIGDVSSSSPLTGASNLSVLGGAGITTVGGPGTKVTINHQDPPAPNAGTLYEYITDFRVDAFGHVGSVNKAVSQPSYLNTIGASNATNITSGILPDARIASSSVTQHQASLSLSGGQISSGTVAAARIDNLDAAKITTGTFADARIASSNVTQHAGDIDLDDLGNCNVAVVSDGAILRYNLGAGEWQTSALDVSLDASPQLGGNLDVNGNDIISVSNGDISITPDGTGKVILDSWVEVTDGLIQVKSSGSRSEIRLYDENTNDHYIGLKSPAHAALSGSTTFTLPSSDGISNQVIQTDGSGNLSFATMTGDKAFKFDPTNIGISRIFDDFMSGTGDEPNAIFLGLTEVTGGTWNNSWHPDVMGQSDVDLFGVCEAETSTGTTARVVMNLPQLMTNSPADGASWLWEVRVKPELATGNGYFMIAAVQPNGGGSIDFNDQLGVIAADDNPRALIFAGYDNTYWKRVVSNSTLSLAPSPVDTAATYTDGDWVRLALHCQWDNASSEYDITFYIDGLSVYTTSLSAGSGSPYGRIELCNDGTASQQRVLFDWSMIQYTRSSIVTYLDIEDI